MLTEQYRDLGRTGMKVSVNCLGTWPMGGIGWGGTDDRQSIATIHTALDAGINFFDTAEIYGDGHSEKILGQTLLPYRDKVYIGTKAYIHHLDSKSLPRALDESLKRLQTTYVDVYFIHCPLGSMRDEEIRLGVKPVPIEETMSTLVQLQEHGKIRAIGVSNFSVDQIRSALKIGRIEVVQARYNPLWRFPEDDLFPFCREHNIGITTHSSLAQGILTGTITLDTRFPEGDRRSTFPLFRPQRLKDALSIVDKLSRLGSRRGKTCPQVALNWIINTPGVTSAIVGARRPEEIRKNVKAMGWTLTGGERKKIDKWTTKFRETLPQDGNYYALLYGTV